MKCLIIDVVHSAIAEELGKYMQVDTHMLPTSEELAKLIPGYDVLIMRVDPKITKAVIDAADVLKVIGVCSVGLNHVDLDAAKAKGIQVFQRRGRADHLQDAGRLPPHHPRQRRREGEQKLGQV